MTVRGGGIPIETMANNAVRQNGSAASELAADAYPCIMLWVFGPPHTSPPPAPPTRRNETVLTWHRDVGTEVALPLVR
jgi:hypothetical protein